MGLKVFAAADLHIGMKFARYGDDIRPFLIQARMDALSRMIEKANKASCDLFILAGDLFDRPNCRRKTVLEVLRYLDRFEGKLVALLPGNHDYVQDGPGSLWSVLYDEAGDRVLLLTEKKPYDLHEFDLDAVLYPGPCEEKHSSSNSIGWIGDAETGAGSGVRIGIAHGSIEGISPDFDGRYYPMGREELLAAGLDFWIIGHTHLQWSDGTVFIPGTPEPDGFDCAHEGAAWLIEPGENGTAGAETVTVGTYRFLDLTVDITPDQDPRLPYRRSPSRREVRPAAAAYPEGNDGIGGQGSPGRIPGDPSNRVAVPPARGYGPRQGDYPGRNRQCFSERLLSPSSSYRPCR